MVRVQEFDVGVEPEEALARLQQFAGLSGLRWGPEYGAPVHRLSGGGYSLKATGHPGIMSFGFVELEISGASAGRSHVSAKWRWARVFPYERAYWEQMIRQFETALCSGTFDIWAIDAARRRFSIAGWAVVAVLYVALRFLSYLTTPWLALAGDALLVLLFCGWIVWRRRF